MAVDPARTDLPQTRTTSGMRTLGYDRIDEDDLFRLTAHDVSRTFVTSLQKRATAMRRSRTW